MSNLSDVPLTGHGVAVNFSRLNLPSPCRGQVPVGVYGLSPIHALADAPPVALPFFSTAIIHTLKDFYTSSYIIIMHSTQLHTPAAVQDPDVERRVAISPVSGSPLSLVSTAANAAEAIGTTLEDYLPIAEPCTLATTVEAPNPGTSSLVFPLLSATLATPAIFMHACELDNKTLLIFREAATQDQQPWTRGVPASNFPDRSQAIGGGKGMMSLASRVDRCIVHEEDLYLLRPPRPSIGKQPLFGHPCPRSSSTSHHGRKREQKDLRLRNVRPKSYHAPVTVQRCIEQEHNNIKGGAHNFADAESGFQILYRRIKVAYQGYAARVARYVARSITSGPGRDGLGAGMTGGGSAGMV
ncbi:hypothetical protein BDN71DRAFT_1504064 [Pleurotus eryngii]|uniref:Uncharacterized protein n=1 Tax=Pleurotus eryngii TaxID=5323 RepID=A0A9P6A6V7_PLEER|nr:hypothetical protein BDN71DRAFT_1504064 [Pleurotus eryngii]